MYKQESVLENKTDKIIWDLEMQTDHLIRARQSDLVMEKKRGNLLNSGLSRPGWPPRKIKENEKRDKSWN